MKTKLVTTLLKI